MDEADKPEDAVPLAVEPALPGAPIGAAKPVTPAEPITDPEIPELQDRRRPKP